MSSKKYPFLLFFILLHNLHCSRSLDSESTGFSLKLTRHDFNTSVNSTYYFPNTIRPTITRLNLIFTIEASIGTPGTKRSFIFDPGTDVTWTQCTPCTNCFKQDYPLFDPKSSKSYKKLPPKHSLAKYFKRSKNGDFLFHSDYLSGQLASGIVSTENFGFPSHKKTPETLKNIVFGCANNQKGQFRNSITGIMGMNRSPLSLFSQMRTTCVSCAKRFSYCLPHMNTAIKTTFLRFGTDIKGIKNLRKTSFLNRVDDHYRLKLLGITISGSRLNLPSTTFREGCVMDPGCGQSVIETHAYNQIVKVLEQYFKKFKLVRSPGDGLCYKNPPNFNSYPNGTLHFQGANLEMGHENLFYDTGEEFCLAMRGADNLTILGAFQQQNVRFVYDLGNKKLFFGKETCSADKP